MGALEHWSEMPAWVATAKRAAVVSRAITLLAVVGCLSCGPERTYTGVWQQSQCGDDATRTDCDGYLYELHIGRYGDAISGVLVRYRYDETAFDGFRAPSECGCFLIDGGRARDDGFELRLFEPETPRTRSPDGASTNTCAPMGECSGRRFDLMETSEGLEGQTSCDDGASVSLRFVPAVGSPRNQCFAAEAPP
jgi:hypothetical protein